MHVMKEVYKNTTDNISTNNIHFAYTVELELKYCRFIILLLFKLCLIFKINFILHF